MKKILLPLVAATSILAAASASAVGTNVVTSPAFNVTVNLTSSCLMTTPSALVFNYVAMSAAQGPVAGGGAFTVTCTNTLPYTLALDSTSGTFPVTGLNYTLSVAAGGTGNGSAQPYSVGGSILANQAGNCSGATCSETITHTLTITY